MLRRAKPRLRPPTDPGSRLQAGWVIANHILVSFHVAFISSVLALPTAAVFKTEVLRFIFVSTETLVSALFMFLSFHAGIALHELGHHLTAARLNALNDRSQRQADRALRGPRLRRAGWLVRQFLLAPYGRASGIKREGLNYYPDAPYNLAVAAAGPRASRNAALVFLPPAIALLALGLAADRAAAIYAGRLALGVGVVALLDFLLADPGKYREFRRRERTARERADTVTAAGRWWDAAAAARRRLVETRSQEMVHARLGAVAAPWQFRNCGMGGRHTEKEYPESNVSMQEAMFLVLGAADYQDAQEMTVRLQNRLKEIIEGAEGCRVMGIGLEGGLAPYIERGPYPVPEVRLWAMMKQTIEECGLRPGVDVAIALDPAMSELEIAYRREFNVPDSVGMYLFWRDRAQTVLDRDGVLALYRRALQEWDIPILSIEDGFSENDHAGWQNLLSALGDRVLVIGDDLVTTNDRTIELAAREGLINTVLVKANQIGTLHETILAVLVALGKGLELVVSHRSKSPNDDMEAQIALALNALGLKCGGGANTERLMKYQAVNELMRDRPPAAREPGAAPAATVSRVTAYEEPTNAGIPSVGTTVELTLADSGLGLRFKGATPLGTSAGAGEAIHLVDAMIEGAEYREVIARHGALFTEVEPGVHAFARSARAAQVRSAMDEGLTALWERAQRYDGKGCLAAVQNVGTVIAPALEGLAAHELSLLDLDRLLLSLELRLARRRGKVAASAPAEQCVAVMQRKQNLGMNAVLSVSLAMARGVAHLQGKDLFELLREETIAIIARLADAHGVPVAGSQLADYVTALRAVDERLAAQGTPLFEALREITGVYRYLESAPRPAPAGTPAPAPAAAGAADNPGGPAAPAADAPPARPDDDPLAPEVRDAIADVTRQLGEACRSGERGPALRRYRQLVPHLGAALGRFGLVNNRVFRDGDDLVAAYLAGDELVVFRAPSDAPQPFFRTPWHPGRLITDASLQRQAGFGGEAVDLEDDLVAFPAHAAGPVRVGRIRDMAEQIRAICRSTSRAEAVYILRVLVARLSLFSFRKFLGAKNLQSEVRQLLAATTDLLDTPLARELPLLVRVLVRNIAGGVTKPKLIDHLWNDSIDLAEVHVRGSDIVNEIRRSTHHAIGRGTQLLAGAYLRYLETGETDDLARLGYPHPGAADEQARGGEVPREIVARLVRNLESLFGSSEIVGRLQEWQAQYAATLLRAGFGQTVHDEVETVVRDGLAAGNRWAYLHHLRVIRGRLEEFAGLGEEGAALIRRLEALLALEPDVAPFDPEPVEAELRRCVDTFVALVRAHHQDALFAGLADCIATYEQGAWLGAFEQLFALRRSLRGALEEGAFPEQRLLMLELDCLLEEMGYLALRHISSRYEESGVEVPECLRIIRLCALNLTHDGLHSRQLRDLVDMLTDPALSHRELANILTQVQRNFHHLLRRLVEPFERMREVLELAEDELRISMANLQRFLHDLNSMVAFTDLALAHVEQNVSDKETRLPGADAAGGSVEPGDPADIVHLSHRDRIRGLVASTDPAINLRRRYGGKGSGLIYISHLGVPTRDGFVLPVPGRRADGLDPGWPPEVVDEHLAILEDDIARRDGRRRTFGGVDDPLLLAVRGGSVFSMPGILGTVLFVGMNDEITAALARTDPWHAYDSYRRFLASLALGVWGFDVEKHSIVETVKRRHGVRYKQELPWEGMREIAETTRDVLREAGFGVDLDALLADPRRQLRVAIRGVHASWHGDTARRYREVKGICDSWQTAVVVQEMASGNHTNPPIAPGLDETQASLTGVVPRTVVNRLGGRDCVGEFKFSAAGEDLVGGRSTAISLLPLSELGTYLPMLDRRVRHTTSTLRRFMGTDQEIEFTVDRGVLSVLQSRATEIGANRRRFSFPDPGVPVAHGIGVRGSAFRGLVAFTDEDVARLRAGAAADRDDVDGVVMLLENPSPEDIPRLLGADALLAAKGGSTSHAAVAINGIGDRDYHAVVGAAELRVDGRAGRARVLGPGGDEVAQLAAGDVVSIDGATGAVYLGARAVASL